ncbi:hypothetical protein VNO80_17725 [Phaseolus coccineus]|uniref:Pentatricopeptide repeat-containing protein n=1 Tax=Phaseolus coccineus TaxID=3886 RepID=A0AAN9MCH4_PHACN
MLPITLLAKPFRSLTMLLLAVPKFVGPHLFDEMTERGFVFSTLLFGMFVWRVCGERVVSLLDEVRECCFGINGSVGGFVVHDLCRASKVWEALWMLDELRSFEDEEEVRGEVTPRSSDYRDLKTYNILIQKFSEVGQAGVEEAQMFIYHMLDKGTEPDVTSYTFLLEGLCQEDKIEAPFELYNKYVEQDIIHARDILSFLYCHSVGKDILWLHPNYFFAVSIMI